MINLYSLGLFELIWYETPEAAAVPNPSDLPSTGDSSAFCAWLMLALLSAGCAVMTFNRRRA